MVVAPVQGIPPSFTHFDVAWIALQARPHLPQSVTLSCRVDVLVPFGRRSRRPCGLQTASSFADLTQ